MDDIILGIFLLAFSGNSFLPSTRIMRAEARKNATSKSGLCCIGLSNSAVTIHSGKCAMSHPKITNPVGRRELMVHRQRTDQLLKNQLKPVGILTKNAEQDQF